MSRKEAAQRIVHERGGVEPARLDGEVTELALEPSPPNEVEAISGLEERRPLARAAGDHEAGVPAVLEG